MNQDPHVDPPGPTARASGAVVLVGFDGSESSRDALSWASGEARRLRGRILAVFVSSSADIAIAAASSALVGVTGADEGCGLVGPERAEALGHELAIYAAEHDLDLTFVHAHGDAACELLRLAAAHRADQIVVGRSAKARHHLLGSLGRRLAGKRDAPVVVVVPSCGLLNPAWPG